MRCEGSTASGVSLLLQCDLNCVLTIFGNSPIRSAWLGASRLATNRDDMKKVAITRQEYQENGSVWAGRKFAGTV